MSDDGYSLYGDDDLYWDDELSQNLADDLAEHTMPSPVYIEDPAYELTAGCSDWEYYSDDYYDDDPELQRRHNTVVGLSATVVRADTGRAKTLESKRGRKRKLAETSIPELSLDDEQFVDDNDRGRFIKGTIWKTNSEQPKQPHQRGQSRRVSLLKDWRQLFEESQPMSDRRSRISRRQKSKATEDWANDLSLTDMGLTAATGKTMQSDGQAESYHDEAEAVHDAESHDLGDSSDEPVDAEDDGDLAADSDILLDSSALQDGGYHKPGRAAQLRRREGRRNLPSRKRKKINADSASTGDKLSDDSATGVVLSQQMFSKRKRRKTSPSTTTDARPTPQPEAVHGQMAPSHRRGRPRKHDPELKAGATTGNLSTTPETSAQRSKKRKHSEELDGRMDGELARSSTTSSRAKRVASGKLPTAKEKQSAGKASSVAKTATRGRPSRS